GRQRASERGIGITIHQKIVGFFPDGNFFNPFEHFSGHCPMAHSMDTQIIVRHWDRQFIKKNLTHFFIEMLPGMNNYLFDTAALSDNPGNRGSFNKLGSGSYYCDDLHLIIYFWLVEPLNSRY